MNAITPTVRRVCAFPRPAVGEVRQMPVLRETIDGIAEQIAAQVLAKVSQQQSALAVRSTELPARRRSETAEVDVHRVEHADDPESIAVDKSKLLEFFD